MVETRRHIREHLEALYGSLEGADAFKQLCAILDKYRPHLVALNSGEITERDAMLITYGDQVRESGVKPLQTLGDFCRKHIGDSISCIHILPFYPFTSDDGFSVVDYKTVNPDLGDWHDVTQLSHNFRLMFDAVINHISAESEWFRGFLRDDPAYRGYFITVKEGVDLSKVVRPRALPLLTKFNTPAGEKLVWTTFSEDQIDLNYKNHAVLLEVIDALLFYVSHGAEFLRLDAVAYLWKEIGTNCIHLPQTHRIIQLIRAVFEDAAPWVKLITETNVPHKDNISYFGDGANEAHLVYNFALPPLTLHALQTGNAEYLSRWAAGLSLPSNKVTFFNFLASHDGIGLNPARGILPDSEIDEMLRRVQAHGGLVSHKHNSDGSKSPYELNVNYLDALADPKGGEPIETQVGRFMAAQAIMLSLVGLPGIYFHSLFGSRGWPEGVKKTGRNRTINRQKLNRPDLERELADASSLRSRVFARYQRLLKARARSAAFHPRGSQRIIDCGTSVFAVLRASPDGKRRVLCLHNVSKTRQPAKWDPRDVFANALPRLRDLVGGKKIEQDASAGLSLEPYQVSWLADQS